VRSNVTQGLKTNPIWACYDDCPITEKGGFYDIAEKGLGLLTEFMICCNRQLSPGYLFYSGCSGGFAPESVTL
jgi:hypothetical protein